ncbi:slipin family protein [Corynebacterium crudilactis]|uniref:Band 7 domain-containing protein n=1 Tax=Corynebacterium crudilactis TaxID=1652495 RepID=A0A172QWZ5_9CORY|nr:slipin family protein [Corynebacterium crudilactis]ANE05171.1 hypothetical protein ccrud_13825 [Corynebacterium crudilactis]
MGIFRSRSAAMGWSMYAPGQAVPVAEWQSSAVRSPVPQVGFTVLRQRDGEISRLKGREFSRLGDQFRQVDLRRRLIQIHPQSIPTADAMSVTITLALTASTLDPVKFIADSQNPEEEIYLAAQIALREMVVAMPLEDFIGVRIDLEPVLAAAQAAAKNVGVEVSSVLLKDLNLPREYSGALQESIVARIQAETDLERARNEVKTTRARLASAKVLEQNPILAKIRMLEALPPGSTIEVRDGDSKT